MNMIDQKCVSEKLRQYHDDFSRAFVQIDASQLQLAITAIKQTMENSSNIFIMGNGGSATTASHLANDLMKTASNMPAVKTRIISLTDNSAIVTALSNDGSYQQVFEKQLQLMMVPGDLVIMFTASGNSQNLTAACQFANLHGGSTLAITAFNGGVLAKMAQFNIHLPTALGNFQVAECLHLSVAHLMAKMIAE